MSRQTYRKTNTLHNFPLCQRKNPRKSKDVENPTDYTFLSVFKSSGLTVTAMDSTAGWYIERVPAWMNGKPLALQCPCQRGWRAAGSIACNWWGCSSTDRERKRKQEILGTFAQMNPALFCWGGGARVCRRHVLTCCPLGIWDIRITIRSMHLSQYNQ